MVSTDLHMRVLANHPICGQKLEREDKNISPGKFLLLPYARNRESSHLHSGTEEAA